MTEVVQKGQVTEEVSIIQEEAKLFSWKDVALSIPLGKNETKQLLKGVSGNIKAGEVVAIMGGSGAGKSTLLNTLAGRIGPESKLEGEILVDGHARNPGNWKLQCAYVEQDDILLPNLTVYETIMYSARLRLSSRRSMEEKLERVDKVIRQLGLDGCRNTKIGDSLSRGISGGERKRVSIGVELVTNPQILFLDEPTSGLDAFNAFNAMETLKNLAKEEGKIVLMTIHQPRTDILDLFDKILLLSAGSCVWFGSTPDCIKHFIENGFSLPPKTNPSDFFLDTITVDQRSEEAFKESTERSKKLVEAYKPHINNDAHVTAKQNCGQAKVGNGKVIWPSTWLGEFYTLLDRNIVNDYRNKLMLTIALGLNVFVLILCSALFNKVTLEPSGIQNRLGLFFFLVLNMAFSQIMPTINTFPDAKQLIKRERSAGSYRASSAFMAVIFAKLPLLITGNLIISVPLYWIIGFQIDAVKFFTFLLICLVHATQAYTLGLCIGAASPNATIGQAFGPLLVIVYVIFSGLLVNIDSIWPGIRWIQWIDFIAYSYKALAQNEFDSNLIFNCPEGSRCYRNGSDVISAFGLGTPGLWPCIFINIGFIGFYVFVGIYIFCRTSAPVQKLK